MVRGIVLIAFFFLNTSNVIANTSLIRDTVDFINRRTSTNFEITIIENKENLLITVVSHYYEKFEMEFMVDPTTGKITALRAKDKVFRPIGKIEATLDSLHLESDKSVVKRGLKTLFFHDIIRVFNVNLDLPDASLGVFIGVMTLPGIIEYLISNGFAEWTFGIVAITFFLKEQIKNAVRNDIDRNQENNRRIFLKDLDTILETVTNTCFRLSQMKTP